MKRVLILFLLTLVLGLSVSPAVAEEVFSLSEAVFASPNVWDASYRAANLTTSASYVNSSCTLPYEGAVSLSIAQEATGTLVYSRDYGVVSGTFRSEDIYLKLESSTTSYQVQLNCGEQSYCFPIDRVMARLEGNAACSAGYPLSSINGRDVWQTVTLLDLNAMEGSSATYDLYASNRYVLGSVAFSVSGGAVCASVSLNPNADVSVDSATVYVASTALEASTLGKKGCTAASGGLDSYISGSGTGLAAVYVKLSVSFQPDGLPEGISPVWSGQEELWQRMLQETTSEAVG